MVSQASSTNVKLIIDKIERYLPKDFVPMQFQLGQVTASVTNDTLLIMKIPLRRIYSYHLATTFYPTFCLMTIACLTLFIDPNHFQATIALSLTTMLVMQTLQENISDDLPKTATIKLVDVWLIAGSTVPFLVFLVLVVVEMLPSEQLTNTQVGDSNLEVNNKKWGMKEQGLCKERVHGWFRLLIPCSTAVFAVGYFTAAFFITAIHSSEFQA